MASLNVEAFGVFRVSLLTHDLQFLHGLKVGDALELAVAGADFTLNRDENNSLKWPNDALKVRPPAVG